MHPAFRTVAEGLGFVEGPQWAHDRLFLVAMSRGMVVELGPETGRVISEIETGGGPNGLVATDSGELYVAQNGALSHATRSRRAVKPGIQRIDVDLNVHDVVVDGCESPNDLVIGADGAVWFTDPGPYHVAPEAPSVKRWDPVSGELSTVALGREYPNGLAFTPDFSALLIADSVQHAIIRYPVEGAGLGEAASFVDLREGDSDRLGYPDGIAFDPRGNLWVAALEAGELVVVSPEGRIRARLSTGEGSRPTNVCFGGSGGDTVFATLSKGGRVLSASVSKLGIDL